MIHPKFPHRLLYVLFICLIAFGLSMGKSLMSIGVIAISANWLLEGKFKLKWETMKERNFLPLIFLLFFVVHLIWGIFSDDMANALSDIKRKLPFLALPIVIGTSSKLKRKELISIFLCFLTGLIISSGIGFLRYFNGDYEDYRDLSRFISHIRLGLFLGMGIGVAFYLYTLTKKAFRYLYLLLIIYFLLFVRILESGTGYFASGIAIILSLIYIAKTINKKWVYISSISIIGLGILAVSTKAFIEFHTLTTPKEGVLDNLPEYTAQHNPYDHYLEVELYENGYPVYSNYCQKELDSAWNSRSDIPIDSLDLKGQPIHGTIMRYMTSKGLMKDAEGVAQLTEMDIDNIKNGISSVNPPKYGFSARFQEIVLEYQMFKSNMNPNDHSLVQRLYYLEAGWNIALENFWLGTTKGDDDIAYQEYYNRTDSPLHTENRLRAHNQLLSFWVCFGLIGLLLILFSIIYPITKTSINFLSILFLVITFIGFLSDDMLDRQAGVTFFALFYCLLYLSGASLKRNEIIPHTID